MNIFTKKKISRKIKSIYGVGSVVRKLKDIKDGLEILRWIRKGRPPSPPDVIYREKIIEEAKREDIKIFIETGTLFGDTVNYVSEYFEEVYSIEVKKDLYDFSKKTVGKKDNVNILHGDSKNILPQILSDIDDRIIFWLDAHCSEGITGMGDNYTPILEEIESINDHRTDHVILVDDLRLFKSDSRYPSLDIMNSKVSKDMVTDNEKDMIIYK